MLNGLEGRNAVVTGSTSGIGLGIAEALAQRGATVMLNGFGDAAEIETTAPDAGRWTNDVEVAYSAADMCEPGSDRRMIAAARDSRFGQRRHPRQQRRHPARRADRGIPAREVGRDPRHQPVLGVPPDPSGLRRHEGARLGPHRQRRLGPRPGRLALQVGLCRRQARHVGLTKVMALERRRGRHHLQRHLPRLCLDAAGREADRRPGEGARHPARAGDPRRLLKNQPNKRFATRRGDRRAHRLPVQRQRLPRSPAPPCRSTAAGPRTDR